MNAETSDSQDIQGALDGENEAGIDVMSSPVAVVAMPSSTALTLCLPDEAATQALGRVLGPLLTPGMVVWLDGDLGTGKTALARAVLRSLGYDGPVKSPTYTLVEFYVISRLYLYHFDFYRFNQPSEFEDAGLGEYFRNEAVCLVEWPDKAAGYVPPADLHIAFHFAGMAGRVGAENDRELGVECDPAAVPKSGRILVLHAHSTVGGQCLNNLRARCSNAAN